MTYRRPTLVSMAALVTALTASAALAAERADDEIVALEAVALRRELAEGRLTAQAVTAAFLRRVATLDDTGPTLRAVIETNPDAEAIARALDERRARGEPLGPLHGIPVLIKANIDTGDRMATTAGSLALAEHRAARDADVVAALRAAGAVPLGKTNLSEWANFRSTASTSGWSSLGGQTRNPYVLDRNPCGSSSGSAVAVAALLAPLALGTETDGSIVCPSAVNGVVGVKPTHGALSQRGIVPLATSQDTAGPIARTLADAELLLGALLPVAGGEPQAQFLDTLGGIRIGIVRPDGGATGDSAVDATFARAVELLAELEATLTDPVEVAPPPDIERAELVILLAEFRDEIDLYLRGVQRGPRTLEELIVFNERHAREVMPHFGQELLAAARSAPTIAGAEYRAARASAAELRARLARLFAAHRLDALVAPANSRAWPTDYAAGDAPGVSSSSLAAITGYPSVAVPIALVDELPVGIAFIGKPGDDFRLLAIARALERARGPFPAPRFLPTLPATAAR